MENKENEKKQEEYDLVNKDGKLIAVPIKNEDL